MRIADAVDRVFFEAEGYDDIAAELLDGLAAISKGLHLLANLMRQDKHTWKQVGYLLDITGQGAAQRYGKKTTS